MKKILVIKGESRFNVLRRAADEIAEGFRTKGYFVCVIDFTKDVFQGMIELYGDYDFVFCCQGMMTEWFLKDGTPFLQRLPMPYFTWLFDDPLLYHLNRIKNIKYDNTNVFLIDKEQIEWTCRLFPNVKNIGYLPHGGFENKNNDYNKNIDILFSANIGKRPIFEEIVKNAIPVEEFLAEQTIKVLEKKPYLSVRKALEVVVNSAGEELTNEMLKNLFRVIYYLDNYIRFDCKYRILESLLKNNFIVHIIGEGGNELTDLYSDQVVIHGGLDVDEVVKLISYSKIVINPISTFVQGMHERILTAMLNKAICFTPDNDYLQEEMGERLQYIYMNDLDKMAKDIHNVLDNYQQYSEILEDNYSYALENHSWKKRGEQIIDYYENQ